MTDKAFKMTAKIMTIIIANWKMNPSKLKEAVKLAEELKQKAAKFSEKEIVVCPPFLYVAKLQEIFKNSGIKLGAQNIFFEEKGAYTGEIAASMLKEFACGYVIVGHSERRHYFQEIDEAVNKKIKLAFKNKIIPILCVGEDQASRENEQTMSVLEEQLTSALNNITNKIINSVGLVIAYEPVWAIGTNNFANPEDVLSVNIFIKKMLIKLYGRNILKKIKIIYGGSVTSKIANTYIEEGGMNGLLIGGASLKFGEFQKIIENV